MYVGDIRCPVLFRSMLKKRIQSSECIMILDIVSMPMNENTTPKLHCPNTSDTPSRADRMKQMEKCGCPRYKHVPARNFTLPHVHVFDYITHVRAWYTFSAAECAIRGRTPVLGHEFAWPNGLGAWRRGQKRANKKKIYVHLNNVIDTKNDRHCWNTVSGELSEPKRAAAWCVSYLNAAHRPR